MIATLLTPNSILVGQSFYVDWIPFCDFFSFLLFVIGSVKFSCSISFRVECINLRFYIVYLNYFKFRKSHMMRLRQNLRDTVWVVLSQVYLSDIALSLFYISVCLARWLSVNSWSVGWLWEQRRLHVFFKILKIKIQIQNKNQVLHTKIVDEKNMEFAMLSHLFYTSTVRRKPSGESKLDVAYSDQWTNVM